jgi:hypothetical protein
VEKERNLSFLENSLSKQQLEFFFQNEAKIVLDKSLEAGRHKGPVYGPKEGLGTLASSLQASKEAPSPHDCLVNLNGPMNKMYDTSPSLETSLYENRFQNALSPPEQQLVLEKIEKERSGLCLTAINSLDPME